MLIQSNSVIDLLMDLFYHDINIGHWTKCEFSFLELFQGWGSAPFIGYPDDPCRKKGCGSSRVMSTFQILFPLKVFLCNVCSPYVLWIIMRWYIFIIFIITLNVELQLIQFWGWYLYEITPPIISSFSKIISVFSVFAKIVQNAFDVLLSFENNSSFIINKDVVVCLDTTPLKISE